jgi:hypothetical protein
MENIFVEFLPPWIETGLQPAFYDKESGTVLQQTARMYARVNMLIRMFNKLSKNTKTVVEDYINQFNELHDYVHDYFDNLDVQEEINNKLDDMAESGQLADIIAQYLTLSGVLGYLTVSDLAAADNLAAGSKAKTYGYKRLGDGVYDLYTIRTKTEDDVADGYNLVALTNLPTLIAERQQSGSELVIRLLPTDSLKDYLGLVAKKTIILPANTTYTLSERVVLNSDTTLDLNNSTLYCDYLVDGETFITLYDFTDTFTGYGGNKNIIIRNGTIEKACVNMMHNKNVVIENVEFIRTVSRHSMQIAGSYNVTIKSCIFNGTEPINVTGSECINIDPCNYGGQPYMSQDSVMYDHTTNRNITVINNIFKNPSDNVTHRYTTAVGSHGRDDNSQTICDGLVIAENNLGSPYASAINMCDYKNVVVKDNHAEFNTANVDTTSYFIKIRGSQDGIKVHNNSSKNSNYFVYSGTDDHVNGLDISNNVVTTNDTTSKPTFGFYHVTNSIVANNEIHYMQTLAILDERYASGNPVPDSLCDGVTFFNNLIDKLDATANQAIRLRACKNILIDNNNFAYLGLNTQAGYAIAITDGLGQSNINITNNKTKFIFNFMPDAAFKSYVKTKNNTMLRPISSQYDYTDTSGSGTFTIPSTFLRRIWAVVGGGTANSNTIEITPWLLDGDTFDGSNKTWKIPVSKEDGSITSLTLSITNSGADYSWSGDVAIRRMYGAD